MGEAWSDREGIKRWKSCFTSTSTNYIHETMSLQVPNRHQATSAITH